eukprot:scaffold2848_cov352-Pavlova_lutheri.AAC.34
MGWCEDIPAPFLPPGPAQHTPLCLPPPLPPGGIKFRTFPPFSKPPRSRSDPAGEPDDLPFERGIPSGWKGGRSKARANFRAMASWEEAAGAAGMAALVGKRVHRSTSRGTEAGTVVLYDMERGLYKVRRRARGGKARSEGLETMAHEAEG